MFKRIRRMWELSKKDPEVLQIYDTLTPKDLKDIPDAGDGKAVFFGPGTDEEYLDLQRKDKGMKGWYDRIKNL